MKTYRVDKSEVFRYLEERKYIWVYHKDEENRKVLVRNFHVNEIYKFIDDSNFIFEVEEEQ